MKYLIFDTYEDALARSEQEGIAKGLAYHRSGSGTRYVTAPRETIDGKWALPINLYNLSEAEEAATVDSFTPPAYEDEI